MSADDDRPGLDGQSDEEKRFQIRDPEGWAQSQRLREIFEARRRVRQAYEEVRVLLAEGYSDPLGARMAYRRAMTNYLKELRSVMLKRFPENGEKYWKEVDLGQMSIQPPTEATDSSGMYASEVLEAAEPWSFEFEGLKTLVDVPSPIVVEFEWTVASKMGDGKRGKVARDEVPWHVMDAAYLATNDFLAEIGFEVEAGKGLDTIVGFDQSGDEPQGEYGRRDYNGNPDL